MSVSLFVLPNWEKMWGGIKALSLYDYAGERFFPLVCQRKELLILNEDEFVLGATPRTDSES